MKPVYFKELDGIRGIAALMVMYFHFWIGIDASGKPLVNYLVKTSVFGQTGVTLFFVLSGFLITRILLSTKNKTNFFSVFYIRRSLRIFPLYYLALVIYLSVAPVLEGRSTNMLFSNSWSYWVYLQNFFMTFRIPLDGPLHFWSLAVEEHFYLFWPLLVYFLTPQQLLKTSGFLIGLSVLFRVILLQQGYEVFYFTLTTMDALAIGAILAIKEKEIVPARNLFSRYSFTLLPLVVLLILLWLFSGGKGFFIVQAFKGTVIALLYAVLLATIINAGRDQKITRLLLIKPLLYTGKISYGLYVYHVLCFSVYTRYLKSPYVMLDFLGCFILSFIVAGLSYSLFEKRFILLKDKIALTGGMQLR